MEIYVQIPARNAIIRTHAVRPYGRHRHLCQSYGLLYCRWAFICRGLQILRFAIETATGSFFTCLYYNTPTGFCLHGTAP